MLFNGLPAGHPRFLFKGGTSLSKAYRLISRFSEDIDITVFREDLGQAASVEELQALSRKKRQARLDAIKDACREYIQNTLAQQFGHVIRDALSESKWYENRGVLRYLGQRVSRHYYDIHRMLQSDLGARAVGDRALAADCAAHARMFFNSPDLGLDKAAPGTFSLTPSDGMVEELHRDYGRMAGMIIGDPPGFEEVMASIALLEKQLNQRSVLGHG